MEAAIEPANHVPIPHRRYFFATDPATRNDRWTLDIGYLDDAGIVHLVEADALSPRPGQPIPFDEAIAWIKGRAKYYNRAEGFTDQAISSVVEEKLRAEGVKVTVRNWTAPLKADALASFREVLFEDRLRIVRHSALIEELVTLRQTVSPSGAVRIAGPGGHMGDYASSALMLVHELGRGAASRGDVIVSNWDPWEGTGNDEIYAIRPDGSKYWIKRPGAFEQ